MSGKITHLKTLYVGSSAGDNTKSLSNGQMEVSGSAYFVGAVALGAGFVTVGALFLGSNVFTTTATGDTVTIAGLLATDRVQAVPYGSSITVNDVLSVVTTGGSFTVHRPNTSGTSALTYFYTIYRPV